MKGLVARGGFVVDMEWENNRLARVSIESALGGNLRVRSAVPLLGDGGKPLVEAVGDNPNLFYRVMDVPQPLVSPKADLKQPDVPRTYLYDIPTEAGKKYVFVAESENI